MPQRRRARSISTFAFLISVFSLTSVTTLFFAQRATDPLVSGFKNPPQSAKPRVWWHWMNGNITKDGIRLDLEWMHRIGLGGFQNFDAAMFTPQIVEHRLAYMTPEWKDAFKYAVTLADQLQLEQAIAASPGWSETGGPWVPAKEAMKKYVWSELRIVGGKPFRGKLPHPPANTGAFQNLPVEDIAALLGPAYKAPEYYADTAVLAFRIPQTDVPLESLQPKVTASGGSIDPALLSDGDLAKAVSLPIAKQVGEKAWIQYEFAQPQTVRGLTIVSGKRSFADAFAPPGGDSGKALEASEDGSTFRVIAAIPKGATEFTLSFAPVTAKYFRFTFKTLPTVPDPFADLGMGPPAAPPTDVAIAEMVLHPGARVNRFEDKAAFNPTPDLYSFRTTDFDAADSIKKTDVIDLTNKMQPDGTLDWTPPDGNWTVLRFGYSLLGITNHPATKEATGLEVDKLNSRFVKNYMTNYLNSYEDTVGPGLMGKHGIEFVVTDSWEAGAQNWSDDIIQEFTRRRGYDPRPWLPALAGFVVENSQASDQFLWDLRKTIADLVAEAHYGQVQESLKERGLRHYGESHEQQRAIIADGMEVKKLADVPMSAMWVQKPGVNNPTFGYNADDRESASVAHIYGQNIAAAESMTTCDSSTAWAWSPATLKPTADQEFLNGINRIVIHESAHQPVTDKVPGVTLGPCGQWFNRNDTWAEQAGMWTTYLARNSFLLQQGHSVADILYFYGEDSNITALFANSAPPIPAGFNFDYINADALIHEVHASDGRITTKSGMSYRLLVLDKNALHMSLPVLRAIQALVRSGAFVAGAKPLETPSLADDAAQFKQLNDQLFGSGSGVQTIGNGKVFAGQDAETALKALGISPDFHYTTTQAAQPIAFVHRKLQDGDLYFLDNRGDNDAKVEADFSVTGKMPELWRSETGSMAAASFRTAGGRTTVPLTLEPWGTVFVVFRHNAKDAARTLPVITETPLTSVEGPWSLAFQPDRGAPPSITLDKLISWTDSPDKGVKYFSGIGTYTKSIDAPSQWFQKGSAIWLDLGDVKNIALVAVNGRQLTPVWHAPYRVDVTSALKHGANQVSIQVINAWVNRLIGDLQPDATTKYTFSTWKTYKPDSPLLPSGLIGPVQILRASGG